MKENVINYTTTKTSNIFFDESMSVCVGGKDKNG